jgi:hypothetical protein
MVPSSVPKFGRKKLKRNPQSRSTIIAYFMYFRNEPVVHIKCLSRWNFSFSKKIPRIPASGSHGQPFRSLARSSQFFRSIMSSNRLSNLMSALPNAQQLVQDHQEQVQRYGLNAQKKREWASVIYADFCKFGGVEKPFPITGRVMATWIHFLGESGYAYSTIQGILFPNIRDLSFEKTQVVFSKEDRGFVGQAYKLLKSNPEYDVETQPIEPCILEDVRVMIAGMPDGYANKSRYASLFLFSVSCGARAISCESIRLRDITRVEFSKETGLYQVDINIPVTKGNSKWNHGVRIEGSFDTASDDDLCYWLSCFLSDEYDLDLADFDYWVLDSELKSQQLWGMSCTAMRTAIQSVSLRSGYPSGYFCYHSLRSGFVSSMVMKSGSSPDAVKACIENSGLVGGWVPGGKPHLKYFKESLNRQIVCSRLVNPALSSNAMDKNISLEKFHNLVLGPVTWSEETNYSAFYAAMVGIMETTAIGAGVTVNLLWDKVWEELVMNVYLDCRQAFEDRNDQLRAEKKRMLAGYQYLAFMRETGRAKIKSLLNEDMAQLEDLVALVKETAEQVLAVTRKAIKRKVPGPKLERYVKVPKVVGHKKVMWTDEETVKLLQLYVKGNGNEEIARELRPRTGQNVSDRIRSLKKIYGGLKEAAVYFIPTLVFKEPKKRKFSKALRQLCVEGDCEVVTESDDESDLELDDSVSELSGNEESV